MKRAAGFALAATFACAALAADYVAVPGGKFDSVLPQGASPGSSTQVDLPSFALRRDLVTVAEFAAFLRSHPEWQKDRVPEVFAEKAYLAHWAGPAQPGALPGRSPVADVSWFAAKAFCESEDARLPTWIEWEYAAAADETRRDARSDPAWRRRILAWYERPTTAVPASIGSSPNAYGVNDLHGLVWEWVDDFNALFIAGDSRTQGDPDLAKFCGSGAINIVDRDSYAVVMRIALLSSLNASDTIGTLGFRCARSL